MTATSRFHTMAVQGIQAKLVMLNSERVYGNAPTRPPITGAPWGSANKWPVDAPLPGGGG